MKNKESNQDFVEGEDYYLDDRGFIVFTEKYLQKRGYCCGSGCRHCPYNYEAVPEPDKSELLARRNKLNPHNNLNK